MLEDVRSALRHRLQGLFLRTGSTLPRSVSARIYPPLAFVTPFTASSLCPTEHARLRIMICGSPKTGNIWLKSLLAHLYAIPSFDATAARHIGDFPAGAFVSHEHILPRPGVVRLETTHGLRFVTMARHPGDVFVSLYHWIQALGESWKREGRLGTSPAHAMFGEPLDSPAVLGYIAEDFHRECLGKTLAWVRAGRARLVRYEALRADPVGVLAGLAASLQPVRLACVEEAVEACRLERLRSRATGVQRRHFRRGSSGEWRTLPAAHRALLEEVSAPALTVLGYSFDPGA